MLIRIPAPVGGFVGGRRNCVFAPPCWATNAKTLRDGPSLSPGAGHKARAIDITIGGDAKKKREAVLDTLKKSIGQELLAQYDAMLRRKYPVKIDREGIDKLFSRQVQRQGS